MKLGGAAATKFTGAKSAYEASSSDGQTIEYKNSDAVREFYLNSFRSEDNGDDGNASNVPDFWGERQKQRDIEAKQMGVYSNKSADTTAAAATTTSQSNGNTHQNKDS